MPSSASSLHLLDLHSFPTRRSSDLLDAMVMVCQILSDTNDNLWNFQLSDGRGIRKGIEFLFPYVKQKDKWPHAKDVMYWSDWPVAHRSEEHTSELQSRLHLVCRLLLPPSTS